MQAYIYRSKNEKEIEINRPNTLSTWRFWKRRGHKPSNRENKQHRHVSWWFCFNSGVRKCFGMGYVNALNLRNCN